MCERLVGETDLRVIAVDNASADATVEVLGSFSVDLISQRSNVGFAAGCNVG